MQGWGFKDSGFYHDKIANAIKIKGDRYMFGGKALPGMLTYLKDRVHADFTSPATKQKDIDVKLPNINSSFIEELGN